MATHIIINPDLDTYSTLEKSYLDVAGEPAGTVTYSIFPVGGTPKNAAVPMNAKDFATSPDIFGLSAGKTALVVAVTANKTTPSAAVLHQHFQGNARAALSVPSSNHNTGKSFNIPISDLTGGGTLFLGNANSTDATATLQYGGSTAPVAATVKVPALGVATVKLAQAETNLIVTVTNNLPIVAQAALGPRFLMLFPIGPAV
jgi:hypothetical protein